MEVFQNQTTLGNEKAIKRGRVVPDGAVNLAFVKAPKMTPEKNVVVVDTSRIVAENAIEQGNTTKLFFANALGLLVDNNGNPTIDDEFPYISDEFTNEGDITDLIDSTSPFPYLHKSRFFHVDFNGLTIGSYPIDYKNDKIKVVDADGNTYLDDNGVPLYRIKIAPAVGSSVANQSAYRIFAYVDTDTNENLYLTYNKVELTTGGHFKNQQVNFIELLNPIRYFEYRPEESEVVDFANRDEKWYSTKPVSLKEQILGINAPAINGYKMYVPKKAVGDPRLFQLFRWRLTCDFAKNFTLTTTTDLPIRCGIVITNSDSTSAADDLLVNMYNSDANRDEVLLSNPLAAAGSTADKTQASYWYVNFDTVTNDDLSKLDILFWAPTKDFDFAPYLSKIDYFTSSLKRQLFIDTNSVIKITNLDVTVNNPVAPYGAVPNRAPGASAVRDLESKYFFAANIGGWDISTTLPVSSYEGPFGAGANVQHVIDYPGYESLMDIRETTYTTDSITSNVDTTQVISDIYTVTSAHSVSAEGAFVSGNIWLVTAPTLPAGGIFDRMEIFHYRRFEGTPGASGCVSLVGPNVGGIRSDIATIGSVFTIAYTTYTTNDPASIGAQWQSDFEVITGDVTGVDEGIIRATLYYHIDTAVDNSHTVIIPQNVTTTFQVPVSTRYPVTVTHNNLTVSTFGHLQSAAAKLTGAQEFIYNFILYSAAGRQLFSTTKNQYTTTYSFSTNWQNSWVINNPLTGPQVLTEDEKNRYQFAILPKDINDVEPLWQRKLADKTCKELLDSSLTPDMLARIAGLQRSYRIEVSNSNVLTTPTLDDSIVPYAWTTAYTPRFIVPSDLSTYVVHDENVAAQFADGSYTYKIYPSKPYSGQIRSVYLSSTTMMTQQDCTWTATGVATETYDVSSTSPDQQVLQQTVVSTPLTETSEVVLSWWNNSTRTFAEQDSLSYTGGSVPNGIALWSENNYYGGGSMNWPYMGMTDVLQVGSAGETVLFVQDFLNVMNYFTGAVNPGVGRYDLPGGYLAIDGQYGPATAGAVAAFQSAFNTIYVDGIIDAETWSVIGGQILRYGMNSGGNTDYHRFYDYPYVHMQKMAISDGDPNNHFAKRSWISGGPSVIWETFAAIFDQNYNIHAVGVIPYVEGDTPTVLIDGVDARPNFNPGMLAGYDGNTALMTHLGHRVADNQEDIIYLPTSVGANSIIIAIGQDGPAFGSSRFLGVRDIRAYAEVSTTRTINTTVNQVVTVPGITTVTKHARDIIISATGTVTGISTSQDATVHAYPNYTGTGTLSNIRWDGVVSNNANVIVDITNDGFITLQNTLSISEEGSGIEYGSLLPVVPDTFSMDTSSSLNPVPETGWINKADGIKILCDTHKNPIGFPAFPTTVGPNNTQRHYVNISLTTYNLDPSVRMAFYDLNKQEFIINDAGVSEMPYAEYIDRGPHNVYIGLISSVEIDAQQAYPTQADSPSFIPNLWAMPVYGVTTRFGGKITLESLPANLGSDDVWPVAVRDGRFIRSISLGTDRQLSSYLQRYQGTSVKAYYGIPEARLGGWSSVFGAPNADVKGEQPIILDDDVIQVRQAPILIQPMPSIRPSFSDPTRAVFKVYKRSAINSPWTALPWAEIRDYNVSTGEIFLTTPLSVDNPELLKVDYTTVRRHYYFKQYNNTILNLNPYPDQSRSFLGKAIYIYILPEYVKDSNNKIITSSVQTRTLRFTTDPTLFVPTNPNYDPTAIELGVVYMSTALDIHDLVILDTRRRGGGAEDTVSNPDLVRMLSEATTYWDVNYGAGMTYQKGGYIVIRLPASLKDDFSESEIRNVIDRNITVGIGYKIEDLNGIDWS